MGTDSGTPTKQREIKWDKKTLAARAWYTAGRMVDFCCSTCGANSIDMADKCSAPLDVPCPGFLGIEAVHAEFERNYHAIVNDGAKASAPGEGER